MLDDILRQRERGPRAVSFRHVDDRRIQAAVGEMRRAAVGEDRQRRRRAERLQAGGERGQADRLARRAQFAVLRAVARLVSPFVEILVELAFCRHGEADRLAYQQVALRQERKPRDHDAVVIEGVGEGVIDVESLAGRVLQQALRSRVAIFLFAFGDDFGAAVGRGPSEAIVVDAEVGADRSFGPPSARRARRAAT